MDLALLELTPGISVLKGWLSTAYGPLQGTSHIGSVLGIDTTLLVGGVIKRGKERGVVMVVVVVGGGGGSDGGGGGGGGQGGWLWW